MEHGKQLISPFEGKPDTRQIIGEDGKAVFEIIAKELTPIRAKVAEVLGNTTGAALAALGGYSVFQATEPGAVHVLLGICLPLLAMPLFRFGFEKLLRKATPMLMSTEEFAFWNGREWQRYSRQLDHRFSLVPHDKTRKEAEDIDYEMRKAQAQRKVIRKKRYYGESYHLSYDYMGQRRDVAVIYGRKEAMAILARLKACDTIMNMQATKGAPVLMRPQDEWGEQPGDIPETT